MRPIFSFFLGFSLSGGLGEIAAFGQSSQDAEIKKALSQAVAFYFTKAAKHGGYVYRYSADISLREAEGIPAPDTIWVQPPGTPAVGAAMLDAFEVTADPACLQAAVAAARALCRTQLVSGGWDYAGHFDPKKRAEWLYRRDEKGTLLPVAQSTPPSEAGWHVWRQHKRKNNYATYDDDVTQAATRLVVRVDHALGGKDEEIRDCADYALKTLIKTQYPSGGWSANFDAHPEAPPAASLYPTIPANYPAEWPRKWPKDFTGCYVLNDNTHATLMSTLLLAADLRKDTSYLEAAKRAGDFLLLAQMPDPQPAWAQQYNAQMQPVWSRAFEPTAISGRESQAAMWSLLRLSAATGEKKYLAPVAKAIRYLRTLLLPGNQLARFYELQTNRPLYFERGPGGQGFELTYSDAKASSNYGWVWPSELDAMEKVGSAIARGERVEFPRMEKERWSHPPTPTEVNTILKEQKPDGSWPVTDEERGIMRNAEGKKTRPTGGVIYSLDFVQNIRALTTWLRKQK